MPKKKRNRLGLAERHEPLAVEEAMSKTQPPTATTSSRGETEAKVYALYYNGVITGSEELRKYNAAVVCHMYGSPQAGTPMDYYNKYDDPNGRTGKKGEPFFDAFLVHLAMIDKSNLSTNPIGDLKAIKYYKAEIQDSKVPNTGENSSLKSLITSNLVVIPPGIYTGAKHIFIMSPMTNSMNEEIQIYCDIQKTNGINVIIHIQGDSIHNDYQGSENHEGNEKGTDNGMTAKRNDQGEVGMFPDAFNLFSGGHATQNFRKYLKQNAVVASVSPVTGKEWVAAKKPVPDYYKEVNEMVLRYSSSFEESSNEPGIIPEGLDIYTVYQDGTDKDNLASLILLGRLNKGRIVPNTGKTQNIPTDFIGLRMYKSTSTPIMPHNLPTGDQKDKMMEEMKAYPGTLPNGAMVPITTLNFLESRTDPEYSKPADSREGHGNLPFDEAQANLTRKFYRKQREEFTNVLTPYARNIIINNDSNIDKFIVDGLGEQSESLRAPFNMSLFFFPNETYQSTALMFATNTENYGEAILAIKGVDQSSGETNVDLMEEDPPAPTSSPLMMSAHPKEDKIEGGRKRRRKKRRKTKRKKRRKSKRRKRRKSKKRRKSRKRRTKRR